MAEPLDLVDADGDRIRFAITDARTTAPVEVAINDDDPQRKVSAEHLDVVAALSLDQLAEILRWGVGVLGSECDEARAKLDAVVGALAGVLDRNPAAVAGDPAAYVQELAARVDGDAWARLTAERDQALRQLDEAHEQHAATQRAWNDHERSAHPDCTATEREHPPTFTFRPAGEHHDVTVALRSIADCVICDGNIPAGAFVVVHPVDDGPDGWAHESCAYPGQPAHAPLNADHDEDPVTGEPWRAR